MTRFTTPSHGSLVHPHGPAARFSGLLAMLRPRHPEAIRTPFDAAPAASEEALEEDPVRGPGWFDSSWDLSRGLEVREGLPGDAKLNEWIESCLRA